MSSLTYDILCCNSSTLPAYMNKDFVFNLLSSLFSITSVVGAILFIFPRDQPETNIRSRRGMFSQDGLQTIICWLAIVNILASFCIFVRSVYWLILDNLPLIATYIDIICACFAGLIQFSFLATYLWTLLYAVEVVSVILKSKEGNQLLYHIIVWGGSIISTTLTTAFFYKDQFKRPCNNTNYSNSTDLSMELDLSTFGPFAFTGLPVMVVMVVNPILYIIAGKNIKNVLTRSSARYTEEERRAIKKIKWRFFIIVMVFYVCWLPNVIGGIWWNVKGRMCHTESCNITFRALFYLMAVLNPLQALLNSIAYLEFNGNFFAKWNQPVCRLKNILTRYPTISSESNERSPLMCSNS